jgi:DNA-binding CsgD family transcriptional regulator/PAS domain-containing protein
MSAESVILDLVGSVYSAANDPQLWAVFLEEFAEAVHATSTSIYFYDLANLSASMFHFVRSDSEWWSEYSAHYAEMDPWAAGGFRLGLDSGDVATGEMLCPNDTLRRSAFANDFLQKGGVFHECCGVVFREPRGASVISCLRPKRFGPFGDDHTRLLRLLMPHLQRALQLHTRIVGLENKADSASQGLDRLPVGFLAINAAGKVLLVNRRAQEILDLNDGLTLGRDGLVTPRREHTNSLRGLIQGAIATASGKGIDSAGAMSIPRPSLLRAFQVLVTPLQSRTSALLPDSAAAAVSVSDPESRIEPPDKLFARLFGLTPAEARLAGALMRGDSLTDAADEFRISRNTVRSQLRSIFDKTATSRQGDLIRLLWSGPAQTRLD